MGSSTMIVQFFCLVFLLVSISKAQAQLTVFDITKLGGVADGKTDNSKAFSDAWTQACQNNGGGVVLFPAGTFLVRPMVLVGNECKGRMEVRVQGTVLAATDKASSIDIDHWINFQHVDNFFIGGGGSFDGQGDSAWPNNTCKQDPNCPQLPHSLRFDFVSNAIIDHITSINSKMVHIKLYECHALTIRNVSIKAPGDSPNTDGINLGMSHHIQILDSVIATGDDCIAFSQGTNNVNISGVQCGPGHGISIGSLGKKRGHHVVSAVDVRNSGFVGTQNGLRIKTWGLPNPGRVSQINFEHIHMDKVDNPIIIDQQYCPSGGCSTSQSSGVQVEDVTFNDIRGTGSTPTVVTLKCSKTRPCKKIVMTDINLTNNGKPAVSACSFAEFTVGGQQIPAACTKNVTSIVPHLVKIGRLSNQIHI